MVKLYTENWEINNINTVLFDKDGTFIDAHTYWGRIIEMRIEAVMKKYNIADDAFSPLCLSLGFDTNKRKLIPEGPIALLPREEVITSLLKALKTFNVDSDENTIGEIFKEVHGEFHKQIFDYIKIIDGAEDLFKKLKKENVKLAVVTSDTYENAVTILEHLDLIKYFDLVIGKDNCTKAKKTGEPALIALEKLGAKAENTISVGDAQMDYLMAKNAGLSSSILVATGQILAEELKIYTQNVVNNLSEVMVSND